MDYLTTHSSLLPMRRGFAPDFVNYKKRVHSTRCRKDKVYQLLAHGRWFSLGTLASSTTKTGRHNIAEILLKVALDTKKSTYNEIMILIKQVLLEQYFFSLGTIYVETFKTDVIVFIFNVIVCLMSL